MSVKFSSGIYNQEHLAHKDKQHKENLWYIRRFMARTQKIFSGKGFKLENGESWAGYTPFQLLYDVAKLTDWINQVEYNLRTFIHSYLTEEEKQIFNVVYRTWLIEAVEYTLGTEEGIIDEDAEPVQEMLERKYKEYDGTTVPPYIEEQELTHKIGRQLGIQFQFFYAGEKGSITYHRNFPLTEMHDLMHYDKIIDRIDAAMARELQAMFEEEKVKYEDGIKKEEQPDE